MAMTHILKPAISMSPSSHFSPSIPRKREIRRRRVTLYGYG
jgi:hypothetical protein